jgi:hypothetical protein
MKKMHRFMLLAGSAAVLLVSAVSVTQAQTPRALDRRVDRNARQIQRQVNRADYYTAKTWQQMNPWLEQNGIAPLAKAAQATRSAVNGAGRAVVETADAASRRLDGQFGFRDESQANVWFYDYYTYTPTYYSQKSDEAYADAIRYFDSDQDGVYDSYAHYRDSDNDGVYDEYDRVDFIASNTTTAKSTETSESKSEYTGPEDARRHKVKGKIDMIKTATVNDHKHLIVGVKNDKDSMMAVDLGPAEDMEGKSVEVGRSIVATGAIEMVGEKKVLVADSVRIGDDEVVKISLHNGLSLTGKVIDVKTTMIGSAENYIAIVDVEGERQLVDLGPVATFKVKVEPSTMIKVRGIPVRSEDHRVIMAERVEFDGETYTVDRVKTFKF